MIQQIICPICQKPATDPRKTPFCSDRCRKIDFFRWWDGRYSISSSVDIAFDPESGEMLQNPEEEDHSTDKGY